MDSSPTRHDPSDASHSGESQLHGSLVEVMNLGVLILGPSGVGKSECVIELVRRVLEAHRGSLRVTDLDLAAFVVVTAVEGVGAHATSQVFDERLEQELTSLLALYLTGSEPPDRRRV